MGWFCFCGQNFILIYFKNIFDFKNIKINNFFIIVVDILILKKSKINYFNIFLNKKILKKTLFTPT
jgi:hypothetical protein